MSERVPKFIYTQEQLDIAAAAAEQRGYDRALSDQFPALWKQLTDKVDEAFFDGQDVMLDKAIEAVRALSHPNHHGIWNDAVNECWAAIEALQVEET